MSKRFVRLLSIAGSDSGGGAGIQADIKTATALGAYAMTALTAVTAQDTRGIHAVHPVPPDIVRAQIRACLDDIGADVVKIGMLGSASIAETVADVLREHAAGIPVVLDPVLVSTSGMPLLDEVGTRVLREHLIPLATLVTPNIPEAELLTGIPCTDLPGIKTACGALMAMGAKAALIKGGHSASDSLVDVLVTPAGTLGFERARIDTRHTHGTGCTYAAAIAVGLGKGDSIADAVSHARAFVQTAIETAPGFGEGQGPLNHMHTLRGDSVESDVLGGASFIAKDRPG